MKTRTKDKYRIVYTENQRLELEKEFIISRYITTSRKMQLSVILNLSQRQIKIWFQNRRAKERKQVKRSVEQLGSDTPEIPQNETPKNADQSVAQQEVMTQIMQVQKELFLLQRQKELFLRQNNEPKEGFDEVYKFKEELFNKQLQALLQRQNELKNNDVENITNN